MTTKAEVIYFQKPCPHCKAMLFREDKRGMAWSECRNAKCSFIASQVPKKRIAHEVTIEEEPQPYRECFNRN